MQCPAVASKASSLFFFLIKAESRSTLQVVDRQSSGTCYVSHKIAEREGPPRPVVGSFQMWHVRGRGVLKVEIPLLGGSSL